MSQLLLIDFDGVLHSYTSGWKGARVIPDPPVPGAIKWLRQLLRPDTTWSAGRAPFEVCIYSSRSQQWGGKRAMKRWLLDNGLDRDSVERIKFPTRKPAAFLTIDDRCICFKGVFPSLAEIAVFRPWNKKDI